MKNLGLLKTPVRGATHSASCKDAIAAGLLPAVAEKFDSRHTCYAGCEIVEKGKTTPLQHTGTEHILAIGPCRSGKTAGSVLPTLLDGWMDSAVVLDIKGGENYRLTAGYRKSQGNQILKFSPMDSSEDGCHFNPLDAVRVDTEYEIKDAMEIAMGIVDTDGRGQIDHWEKTCVAFLTSVILHVLYAMPDKTLRGVAVFLNNPALKEVDDALLLMMNTDHAPDGICWIDHCTNQRTKTHPVIAQTAKEMLNKADIEKSGIFSMMMSILSPYCDPVIAKWTAYSDFRIEDLQDSENPVTLYLVSNPWDREIIPLFRLILNQIVTRLTAQNRGEVKHRLLLLLDESQAIGLFDALLNNIKVMSIHGIKLYLIVQARDQLEHNRYGEDGAKVIADNTPVKVIYPLNTMDTAEWAANIVGSTADDLLALQNVVIASVAGFQPIYGRPLRYFENADWVARSQMNPQSRNC